MNLAPRVGERKPCYLDLNDEFLGSGMDWQGFWDEEIYVDVPTPAPISESGRL